MIKKSYNKYVDRVYVNNVLMFVKIVLIDVCKSYYIDFLQKF